MSAFKLLWWVFSVVLIVHVMSYNREQVKDVVKMLGQMNALDHIIAVAAEHGIKDIKPLLEVKS